MTTLPGRSALLVTTIIVSACATALPGGSPTPPKALPADTSGKVQGGSYVLSEAERALDCKKLTGRMQLKILQTRGADQRPNASIAARATQSVVTPVFGGTSFGSDPQAEIARNRAILVAYNEELRRKGCPTFDLDAELTTSDVKRTPRPIEPPPAKQ
jgi:hypothetical protein